MRFWIVTGLLVLGISGTAQAADWMEATRAEDGTIAYIDVTNSGKGYAPLRLWVKYDLSHVRTTPLRNVMELVEIRCDAKTIRTLQKVSYDPAGNAVGNERRPYAQFEDMVPETLGSGVVTFACDNDDLIKTINNLLVDDK
jgi:hypothetical protein